MALAIAHLLIGSWLAQAGPGALPGQATPGLEAAAAAVVEALAGRTPLAVPAFLREGGRQDVDDLQAEFVRILAGREVGIDGRPALLLAPGPQGLADLTKRLGVEAALGATLIQSSQGAELALLVVDAEGRILLDAAFALSDAVSAEQAPPPAAEPAAAPDSPDPTDAERAFARRRLTWVPSQGSSPSLFSWRVHQGPDRTLTELELCQVGGRPDLAERVRTALEELRFRRDLGIGLTLAGLVAAGLSTPLLMAEDENAWGAGIGLVSLGLASAAAGAVLWGLFGPEIDAAGAPHLLEAEEARDLVEAHNGLLRRELGLPPVQLQVTPLPGGAAGGVRLRF
jgi:hypothetical protein